MEGNYAQAAAYCSEALSIARRQGDVSLIHYALLDLGRLALIQGHNREAAERFEEDLAYFRKKGHKAHMAGALYFLGFLAWAVGDVEQAWRRYTDVLNTYGDFDSILKAGAVAGLGKVAFARGETHQALLYSKQALGIPFTILLPENGFLDPTMIALEAMAALAADAQRTGFPAAQGQMEGAARLLGATEAWHKMFYYTRLLRERQEREACISALRAAMSEPAFTTAWTQGLAMSEEQAVEYADLIHYPENPGNLHPIS
jgi:tetratricopeptide (TPR) repeat protein